MFNILLQILDDGRLTDSQGRLVNFKNTVIIMTSNIGSRHLLENVSESGKLDGNTVKTVMSELHQNFKPEFLNRVDDIVMFKPLTRDEIRQIVRLVLKTLSDRLREKEIDLDITEGALDYIVKEGWDPEYGARPIKRFIEKYVETELSRHIVMGDIGAGDTALVNSDGAKLLISRGIARKPEN